MIPVWQTRHGVEAIGNCLEACVASILEVPLAVVPDRAALVDADAHAEAVNRERRAGRDPGDLDLPEGWAAGEDALRVWLLERGLALLDFDVVDERTWLAEIDLVGAHWIATTLAAGDSWSHATVWHGARCVHNPNRHGTLNPKDLGDLHRGTVLVASEPAMIARLQPLPDVAGELDAARFDRRFASPPGVTDGEPYAVMADGRRA